MRLDYFLKLSRLVKRRPLAHEMCDKHLVQVNAQPAKAGKELRVGDAIAITFPRRIVTVRVETLPDHALSKQDASAIYTLLEDRQLPKDEWLC